ncbi:MAG: peptidoglycan bridge formation glycyltransferase FemA/FemB family protein [Peptococcaceae bacterium]|nr:peptidoglycan bridge formation glycyltransferase FemA/FemB family protein [Peptococcaceae bacterium]
MKTRLISEHERERFNNFIQRHPKGHVLQSYEWGEVKSATGWKPYRMVLESKNNIVAAVSVLERRLPFINKPIFYSPRGPVVDFSKPEHMKGILEGIKSLARERGAILWKIDPDVTRDSGVDVQLLRLGFRALSRGLNFEGVQPRFVFRLPLDKSLDEIFASLASKTRYNIRLAARRGVKVRDDCGKDDLRVFYDILQETAQRDRFLIRSFEYYEVIWRCLVEKGMAKLFMAEYAGEAIAGTLAFAFGDKVWYVYGASSNRHRRVMPNYALQWAMIRWAKSLGCRIYDFRGVSGDLNPDNPLYGLYRFKKGFAGDFTEFIGEFDYPLAPLWYQLWVKGEPAYREWRGKVASLKDRLKSLGRG